MSEQQVPDESSASSDILEKVIEKYYMDKDAPSCDWKHFKYAFLAGMKYRDGEHCDGCDASTCKGIHND